MIRFNNSTLIETTPQLVHQGENVTEPIAVSMISNRLITNMSSTPITVEDPDKGNGFKSLLPTCTIDYQFNGFVGDAVLELKIDCVFDSRWGSVLENTGDPTTFKFALRPEKGVKLVGEAVTYYLGPQPGSNLANKFAVLIKQVVEVIQLPAILKAQFTYQINKDVDLRTAASRKWPVVTDVYSSWRSIGSVFQNPRPYSASFAGLTAEEEEGGRARRSGVTLEDSIQTPSLASSFEDLDAVYVSTYDTI